MMKYDGNTVKQWAGSSQWRAWRADVARARSRSSKEMLSEGIWALTIYRLQRSLRRARPRLLWLPMLAAVGVVKWAFRLVTQINISADADIGPGFLIVHGGPIHITSGAVIGADCAVHHVCTIGTGSQPGAPRLADHVLVGCHACVLGPVRVGTGAQIGAGAVVVKDVPEWSTVVGVPARVVNTRKGQRDAG